MITSQTNEKILKGFYDVYKDEIAEINCMISELWEWFEEDILKNLYNKTEMKIIEEWEKSGRVFPSIELVGESVILVASPEIYEGNKEIPIDKGISSRVAEFFCSGGYIRMRLSSPSPLLFDPKGGDETLSRMKTMFPEKYEEFCSKVRYIHDATLDISRKRQVVSKVLLRADLTVDQIKKYSPSMYEKVWKN